MAISGRRVTVTTSPTQLNTPPTDGTHGSSILVSNPSDSGGAIDLGGATVTTGAGTELQAGGETPLLVLGQGDDLYGVAASGTVIVDVLETGI